VATDVDGDGLRRLAVALRDAATFAASIERRPWRLDWQDAANQIEILITTPADSEFAEVRIHFASLGTAVNWDAELPLDVPFLLSECTSRIGDVAAEFWRVDFAHCAAVQEGRQCSLSDGHSGRHRSRAPGGDIRWGDRP